MSNRTLFYSLFCRYFPPSSCAIEVWHLVDSYKHVQTCREWYLRSNNVIGVTEVIEV